MVDYIITYRRHADNAGGSVSCGGHKGTGECVQTCHFKLHCSLPYIVVRKTTVDSKVLEVRTSNLCSLHEFS